MKESRKGRAALVTFVLRIVYLLDGLWKLNLLNAIPQAKKVRLQRQQYLQKRVELFTNYGSPYSRQSISLMKQKAGTLAKMKRMEKPRGVVFIRVYFMTAIFSFIICDTSCRSLLELNHLLGILLLAIFLPQWLVLIVLQALPNIPLLIIYLSEYKMDFILAHSRYQRRKYAEAIQVCDQLLEKNGKDEAAWMLKCQCLIKENYVDELETEEEGMAQQMIKEEDANRFARVGTSFKNANTHANPIMRPTTSGRLNTGFQRVGTSASRAGSRQGGMLRTGRVMTKGGVPTTSSGRILRLSTASLEQYGQNFFDSSKVDLRKVAQRRSKSRLIFQYLFYVEHNLKKCLQLAVMATQLNNYEDPWWKAALGKCYYHLNFLKQSERQFISSARHNNNIESSLYLSKIYEKEDNVDRSISVLEQAKKLHPYEPKLQIAIGRIYDQLQNVDKSHEYYKNALAMENCNTEAVANIASYYFYKDQPEISLKLYQRLIQLGCESPQIWNNMGLCCFSNHQYHLYYTCFERAILNSRDDPDLFSDVWYNIGYIYTIFGQLELAVEAFKITLNYRPDHYEALNNLAVIESKRGNIDSAINYAEKSWREVPNLEAAYNLSIWYFKTNQLEKANAINKQALKLYPQHAESKELATRLLRKLDTL